MPADEVQEAVRAAEAYLLNCQDGDGFWRDYDLEPGAAEAWTTACVGWVFACAPHMTQPVVALRRAAAALHQARKPGGWSYNRHTAPDADSTAWVWRFLSALDDYRGLAATADLCSFLDRAGAAHTFRSPERFGSWATEHGDVTPVVGLALLAVGAGSSLLEQVRRAVLASRRPQAGWRSFWWSTDAYATAQCLEFLAATGPIPAGVKRDLADWLKEAGPAASAFESAQYLSIAATLAPAPGADVERFVRALLDRQSDDHAWPASAVLLVPRQRAEENQAEAVGHADVRRIMSTAMAVWALKKWLRLRAGGR